MPSFNLFVPPTEHKKKKAFVKDNPLLNDYFTENRKEERK
jgi:hypothetical protein